MMRIHTTHDDNDKFEQLVENPPFRFTWTIEQIEKAFTKNKKLSILDVGAGRGILVKLLQNKGHRVDAVDTDQATRKELKKNCKGKLTPWVSIDDIHHKTYDVITCLEVIEHQSGPPVMLIGKIKKRLKKGGILVFTVPIEQNLKDPDHKWYFDFYDVQLFCRMISDTYKISFINKHQRLGNPINLFSCVAQKL